MKTRVFQFLFGAAFAWAVALALLALPTPTSSAPASTTFDIYVDTTVDEFGGAGCSLREAIESANDNLDYAGCFRLLYTASNPPNIFVPAGTYSLTLAASGSDYNANGDLNTYTTMTVQATGAVTVTGGPNWTDRVFHIMTRTVTLEGLTIQGGWVSSDGGGAIRVEPRATLSLTESTVRASYAVGTNGGGIYNSGFLNLGNVTVSGNTAGGNGGGIFNTDPITTNLLSSGVMTATNVTISGNSAYNGGGVYDENIAILTNVTINGNSASNSGGAIYAGSCVHCTVLTNSIVSNSSGAGNCFQKYTGSVGNNGNNIEDGSTCGWSFVDGSMSNTDPRLGPLANNGGSTLTHALKPGSPAIDGVTVVYGGNDHCPPTDQRGAHRPMGRSCDVGTYEAEYLFLPLILK